VTTPNRFRFRAWDIENKKMWSWDDLLKEAEILKSFFRNEFWAINPPKYMWKRMQSIGLLDDEKIEIYQGDIVKWVTQKDSKTGVVYWRSSAVQYQIKVDRFISPFTFKYKEIKVIGNIHEHPHLLEGK